MYVQRFAVASGRQHVSREGGHSPIWRRDGRELFYLGEPRPYELTAVDIQPGADIAVGVPKVLFAASAEFEIGVSVVLAYDASHDGQRFVFVRREATSIPPPPSQIEVIENWFEELKAKVPTRR